MPTRKVKLDDKGDPVLDDDGNEVFEDEDDPDADKPKITQREMQRIAAREKSQGKTAGRRSLVEELGFKDEEELKAVVTDHKAAQDKQLSDAEKREKEATAAKDQADLRDRRAWEKERKVAVKAALLDAGMAKEEIDDDVISMVKTEDLKPGDDIDDETVTAAVEVLKKRRPRLFEEPDDEGEPEHESNRGGTPGTKTPPKPRQKGQKTAEEQANDQLRKRHGAVLDRNKASS